MVTDDQICGWIGKTEPNKKPYVPKERTYSIVNYDAIKRTNEHNKKVRERWINGLYGEKYHDKETVKVCGRWFELGRMVCWVNINEDYEGSISIDRSKVMFIKVDGKVKAKGCEIFDSDQMYTYGKEVMVEEWVLWGCYDLPMFEYECDIESAIEMLKKFGESKYAYEYVDVIGKKK